MKKLLTLALAVVMILGTFCLASCTAANPAENNTKIKIGLTGPLTGGASIYGIAVKNAAQRHKNQKNGCCLPHERYNVKEMRKEIFYFFNNIRGNLSY